jgi:hypothetical protein
MSTATFELDTPLAAEESLQYRALHTGAIIGLTLAVFTSGATILAWGNVPDLIYVALLNAVSVSFCMWSLARIRREPDLYTGRPIAMLGLSFSLACLIGGVGYGSYVYSTEVPEGYTRISFNGLKPDQLQERSGMIVPPAIAALDGQKVFIKGYIRPDSISLSRGIKEFLLVRDNNQCCFGDLSKISYFDQMQVDMLGSSSVDYSQGVFRMGGILKIEPRNLAPGSRATVFSLRADYAN